MTGRADTAEPPLLHFYTAATAYSLPAHSYDSYDYYDSYNSYDSYDSYDFYDSYDSYDSCDSYDILRMWMCSSKVQDTSEICVVCRQV